MYGNSLGHSSISWYKTSFGKVNLYIFPSAPGRVSTHEPSEFLSIVCIPGWIDTWLRIAFSFWYRTHAFPANLSKYSFHTGKSRDIVSTVVTFSGDFSIVLPAIIFMRWIVLENWSHVLDLHDGFRDSHLSRESRSLMRDFCSRYGVKYHESQVLCRHQRSYALRRPWNFWVPGEHLV